MTPAEPYLVSGTQAAVGVITRRKYDALTASIEDANALETQGRAVIKSATRNRAVSLVRLTVTSLGAAGMGLFAANAMDGTYEGALRGNWGMLGFVVLLGVLNFEWGWLGVQSRRRDTGHRLLRRAEYQRRIATLQLGEVGSDVEATVEEEVQHETLR